MVWLVRLGDLTTDCSGASRRQRSLRSRRLPDGAKGSCQAAKGWTLTIPLPGEKPRAEGSREAAGRMIPRGGGLRLFDVNSP